MLYTIDLCCVPSPCAVHYRPAWFTIDLRSLPSTCTIDLHCVPSTCAVYHRPALCTIDLRGLPSTCAVFHRPALSTIDLCCVPLTCAVYHRPALCTIDLCCVPSPCTVNHRPVLCTIDLRRVPSTHNIAHTNPIKLYQGHLVPLLSPIPVLCFKWVAFIFPIWAILILFFKLLNIYKDVDWVWLAHIKKLLKPGLF